jgi:hypothetical protein
MGNSPQAFLQKLQQTGLLPMLMQKMGMKPPGGGQTGGAPPTSPQSITQAAGSSGQPGVGGAPPQAGAAPSGGGGPSVKYDPSGGGASMPPPIAQPHEAVQSIAQLLMGYHDRKKKGEEAEAANIAQNLIQAMRNGDKDTVNDILNNDHSKKILNKVYKGWLTQMQEAQKPGKEKDPTVSGFEAGIQKATSQPQGQPPGSAGGIRLPQPSQEEQVKAAQTSATQQTFKQDPNLMKPTQLTSDEIRETQLGAGPQKIEAEKAKAQAAIDKAASDTKKAQAELQKAEAELEIKKTEQQSAKEKGKISLDIESKKLLIAATNLDVARERLKLSITKTKAGTDVKFATKLKMSAIDKAIQIVTKIQDEKRSFSASDFGDLASELRAAGATELIKRLPTNWLSAHLLSGKNDVTDLLEALQHYKETYQDVVNGLGTSPTAKDKTASGETVDDEDDGGDDGPMEGDVVDGYKFKGGDRSEQSNWEKVKEP